MTPARLRALANAIGLFVAIVSAVAPPVAYAILDYQDRTHHLADRARDNAARLAKYIYTHDSLWQYQRVRVAELLEITNLEERDFSQRVVDANDKLVFDEGPALGFPAMVRSEPVVVAGATKGRIDIGVSAWPLIGWTGIIAGLSILLGFGMYFALRVFPLRALDRTLAELEVANDRINIALSSMAQGLCLFDADQRLILFNARFSEILRVPSEKITPGMPASALMQLTDATVSSAETTIAEQSRLISEHASGTIIATLSDQRIVSISHRPTQDGGFVATFDDITERRRAEERIAHMARHDALTDLPNRVQFYEWMGRHLELLHSGGKLAVFSLDLDHFKSVNDTLGHPIGDKLLQVAAERMRGCLREGDMVARLGGDEFSIAQADPESPTDITALAARLIDRVGAPYDIDGHNVVIGASVGVTLAPTDGTDPNLLLRNADLALYRAKGDGGSTYRFFEPKMDALMQERRTLEVDLRKALVSNEMYLEYQPLINVKTGQVTTVEALVRWRHPVRGVMQPADFIPLAEETALIVPLGEWVLREACKEAVLWPQHIKIAINVSPVQFKSRHLVAAVKSALESSGLPAERLELEITELVLLQDSEVTLETLHSLRDLGVKIAMDDFGTGYSSLSYLRSFPFDKIKIDQSFIRDLPHKDDSLAIVRAVVGLATSLGIDTTAEGVETVGQLESLRNEGCTEAQGFLFAAPRPALEVRNMLMELHPEKSAVA